MGLFGRKKSSKALNVSPVAITFESGDSPGSGYPSQQPYTHAPSTKNSISQEDALQSLKKYDTIIVVDDSGSMRGSRWAEAQTALLQVAECAAKYDTDGIEIEFLNSTSTVNVKNGDVKKLFSAVTPQGRTPIGTKLHSLLSPYLIELKSNPTLKPVNYIFITDGEASEYPDSTMYTETVIMRAAKELDRLEAPRSQVGIQFVQIGDDVEARKFLQSLDDDLKMKYNDMRDIVDTTFAESGEPLDLIKVLTGAVNRRVDNRGSAALF